MHLLSPLTLAGVERVVLMFSKYINTEIFDISLCLFVNSRKRINPFIEAVEKSRLHTNVIYLNKTFEWRQIKNLADILKTERIAVLHTHGYRADIIGYLATRSCKAKLVSTIHGWTSVNPKVRFYEFADKLVLRKFDSIIAVSDDLRRSLNRSGIVGKKISILHNALDFSAYSKDANGNTFREDLGLKHNDKVIGTIGRLSREKGIKYLLCAAQEIVKQCNNAKFLIVGDGPEMENLIIIRNKLGLNDSVIFTGFISDVNKIFAAIDIFILPSLSEGVPLSLLEAVFFKKPFISTNVGGIPELFKNYSFLVNPGNVRDLVDCTLYLLENIVESEKSVNYFHDHILEKCDPLKWSQSIENIYLKLIS